MIKQFIDSDGSNAGNMINFSKKYPNVTQIRLEKNFRCLNNIVDIADNVIENNKNRLPKKMISGRNKINDICKAGGFIEKDSEYTFIALAIQKLLKEGVDFKDIAILVRKGKYIAEIVKKLDEYSIPHISDSTETIFENKYFELFCDTFEILYDFSKSSLFELWKDYCDREKFNQGFRFLRNSINNSNYINLSSTLEQYLNLIGFFDKGEELEVRKEIFNGMIEILNDYEEIYREYQLSAKIKGMMDFLRDAAAEQYKYHKFKTDETEDGVQIMTIHKSKGLEFKAIFIPNIDEDEFPSRKINGKKYWHVLSERFKDNKEKFEGDIEDERKLFYVAITRAEDYLYLTYDKLNPSMFINEAAKSKYIEVLEN